MSKENNDRILKSSLSTLLKRFSNTDLISSLGDEFTSSSGKINISLIDDNSILKKARINENKLEKTMNIIKEKGINSPLLVMQKKERYEVLYPRIVYIAARKLGIEYIPCSIVNIEEEDSLVFLASQIRDSKGGNIVELSLLLNKLQKKYKYKQFEIAEMMEQSRSQITNIMRLIKMPEWILRDISNDKLSFGHARALQTLSENELEEIVPLIYLNNLSVREVEKLIYAKRNSNKISNQEERLNRKYNCKSNIKPRSISISFDDEEDYQKFIKKILK